MDFCINCQKIYQAIKEANRILLVVHQRPDADALGSFTALGEWLDTLGKNYDGYCYEVDGANNGPSFLISSQALITQREKLTDVNYDLVITLDCSDLKFAGLHELLPELKIKPILINIDHHFTNSGFGDINLVDPQAVSTTEILFNLFQHLKVRVTPDMATALLAGIIYDTYSFTNPNTTYLSLEASSKLLSLGANLNEITQSISKSRTIETLKLWGKVLFRLSHNHEFDVVSTVVTPDDFKSEDERLEVTEGIANFLNNLSGIKAVMILQQQSDGIIKGSLRTNSDLIDVSKLAKILGGGGHKKAAGFRVKGQLVRSSAGQWQIT